MQLEADLARFLGTQSCIIYSQGFSTISSVIPAFSKRGDIIVADRGVNFAIQKGIQVSSAYTMMVTESLGDTRPSWFAG